MINGELPWLPADSWAIGPVGFGVLAETIVADTATGDDGPGHLYDDAQAPANAGKELCGAITRWPTGGTLVVLPNGEFTYTGTPDSFDYDLYADGVAAGTATELLGNAGIIAAGIGGATATGAAANIVTAGVVSAGVGNAAAAGAQAGIIAAGVVSATVGAAVAAGATLDGVGGYIFAGTGAASAAGATANIGTATIACTVGGAVAAGVQATIDTAQPGGAIACAVGGAVGAGLSASVITGGVVVCGRGAAVAAGLFASVGSGEVIPHDRPYRTLVVQAQTYILKA